MASYEDQGEDALREKMAESAKKARLFGWQPTISERNGREPGSPSRGNVATRNRLFRDGDLKERRRYVTADAVCSLRGFG